ncbi:hypothetical protein P3H15_31740 [Rhodococcus sp. T2V]|uniref:hypothetical protein n=1 Tax=Rhodococcus sp. T2V TaxID=3034164 RepID=UPI0023E139AE|nr:hypothetical protein [Rhodococcus sp. T2V]MDF3309593.1 hypothetical protein [Rhodococcus sp. T2V]
MDPRLGTAPRPGPSSPPPNGNPIRCCGPAPLVEALVWLDAVLNADMSLVAAAV